MKQGSPAELADRILKGEVRAAARVMRWLDDGNPAAVSVLKRLYPHTGRAQVVGLTGNPGSGKSTLTDQLIAHYRSKGKRVGVIAVDPSSPFSGGAILGDRIRMQRHATDPDVFIRSLATRGHLGGLSRATNNVVHVLDAMGFDVILVETVGVGQDEVDIVRTAHTSVVVLVPGLGDDIQAIKAGILEIADIFVVNKADLDGADRAVSDLRTMHQLAGVEPDWEPPILLTVAGRGEGIPELAEAVEGHRAHLAEDGRLQVRIRERERHVFLSLLQDRAMARILEWLGEDGELESAVDQLVARSADPYTLVEEVLGRFLARNP